MPAEIRRALLEICRQPFGAILGEEAVQLQPVFFVDGLFEFFVLVADHGALYVAKC